MGKIREAVDPDWTSRPLRKVFRRIAAGSRPVATQGPRAANVSKPLARVNWTSFVWRSRAVTSLKQA